MNNRKRNVADVALKLFVEKGIQNTSIQEIIEKASISKGTFYNYFTSKNDCVADILEFLRYDASQQRIAIQFGKDAQDRHVFIEQITILIRLNEERNLNALFEAILASNENELRKLVLRHRVIELEWLENRFIEVIGEEIRECAFEGAILFYGMLQHMMFSMRITNSQYSLNRLVEIILTYIELILEEMHKNNTSQLNKSAVDILRTKVDKKAITLQELEEVAQNLQQQFKFNEEQQDLLDAVMTELNRERIRKIVIKQFLKPMQQLFQGTTIESQVHTFTNLIWYYLKSI
ncbi:TetR/AcrR family transcriptional regulator [Bacillus marasmi]|uniref:TetR/AcrR family transcriptional regulator n=1 Tax=Bacillus marasmi TaxID=1926279 RepID=UPI0011C70BD7|nr:TetR/AcrR family transcriptional regulator [Bacillus marasmi]